MIPTDLIAAARDAARHAYAPYSNFAVGAALLLADGNVVTACNFENASYGVTLCAEAVALAKANSEGQFHIEEIAVIGGQGTAVVRPCGRCRQMLAEAAQRADRDIVVHCSSGDGATIERHLISELLPHAFGPKDLQA